MILFRCFAWDEAAAARARGGPLWFPRMLQGDGRHDNPALYGCLYVSTEPVSAAVERLARLAGTSLAQSDLVRRGYPFALAAVELSDRAELVDLDDPAALVREELRPSRVATNERSVTQVQAGELFERHPNAAGLRWWSTFEALWANVTLFDRAEPLLEVADVKPLEVGDDVVREAGEFLGLPVST
ncbi:MAG TPA: RES domain-containing protein [Gaiellaceae bacterium]|nr:RES domain-containing protein [Gaiellaceae bacterium]